jgi:hypothetical protein
MKCHILNHDTEEPMGMVQVPIPRPRLSQNWWHNPRRYHKLSNSDIIATVLNRIVVSCSAVVQVVL